MNIYAFIIRLAFCTLILLPSTNLLASDSLIERVKQAQQLTPAPLLSRQQFLQSPRLLDVQISPNGEYITYQQIEGNEDKKLTSIWLYTIKTKQVQKLYSYRHINRLHWANNSDYLIIDAGRSIAVSDIHNNPTPIIVANISKKNHEKWLGVDYSSNDSIFVKNWQEKSQEFVVNRVSFSGETTEIYRTKAVFNDFGVDDQGKPLYIRIYNQAKNNKGEEFIEHINGNKLTRIWQCQWDDPCSVINFDARTKKLTMFTNYNSNFLHLASINTATGEHHIIHQDPDNYADLSSVQYQLTDNTLRARILGYQGDLHQSYAIDKNLNRYVSQLTKQFPQQSVYVELPQTLTTEQLLNKAWLVRVQGNKAQKRYFLYQPKNQQLDEFLVKQIQQANQEKPLLYDQWIAPRFAVHYQSRDGFSLQGFVTLPRGVDIKSAPMVAFPHGGPWAQDTDGFSRNAQFLANRGYIVFQPNFRASTGLGKAYKLGTKNDFGKGTTHNDIIDGVRFLLVNNIGDKNKLGIAGHSFGGFSTLTALAFEPEMFQVGFAGAPPSHMGRSVKYYFRFIKKMSGELQEYRMKKLVVDWDDEAAFSANYLLSPEYHINVVSKPLTIWAGKNDRRVFIVDVRNYVTKAQALKKDINLFVDHKAMHSPNSQMTREAYYFLMEATLGHHLGQPIEPINKKQSKALYRFINKGLKVESNNDLSKYLH